MSLTSTALAVEYNRRRRVLRLQIAFVGNYTPGGDVLDLTAILNPNFQPNVGVSGFNIPALTNFKIARPVAGYGFEVVAGSAPAVLATAFKIKVFTTAATEFAAGAYSASLLADTLVLEIDTSTWIQ